jgi:hypothetical protein
MEDSVSSTITQDTLRPPTWAESIVLQVEEYLATVTKEQLEADMKASDFDKWNGIGELIVIPPEEYRNRFRVEVVCVL